MADLFDPIQLGDIELSSRIVMAPMTRSRAEEGDEASDMMRLYYEQRASAGLIITEGVYPCEDAKGYVRTPGLANERQMLSWAKVVEAVHKRGGKIVAQLMHCGRVASHHNKPIGSRTLAPSAIQADGKLYTDAVGMAPFEMPEAMTADEVTQTIEAYANCAAMAREAGFDGVELHATSGYLPAQFLSTGTNHREDAYGGSLSGRLKFTLDTLMAISEKIGSGRVGIRICPGNPFNDLQDDNPEETFAELLKAISPMGLAYLHVIRMKAGVDNIKLANDHFTGPIILNDSYDLDRAQKALGSGQGDAVSFGRHYISNPDLVERFKTGAELTPVNFKTLYLPGAEGYIDYPAVD